MSAYDRDAKEAQALADAAEQSGPCPACGAPPKIELIEVGWFTGEFVPGRITCSGRCYEDDPAAYLAAIANRQRSS